MSRVASGGSVTTYASGFSDPYGLALDGAGNLYVSNFSGGTISKVAPGGGAGSVSTYATDVSGPAGLAFDGAGNLYVANYGGGNIRKVVPGGGAGSVSTYASGLSEPYGLALDGAGNLYVSNFSSTGVVNKVATGGGAGSVSTYSLRSTSRPASPWTGPVMSTSRVSTLASTAARSPRSPRAVRSRPTLRGLAPRGGSRPSTEPATCMLPTLGPHDPQGHPGRYYLDLRVRAQQLGLHGAGEVARMRTSPSTPGGRAYAQGSLMLRARAMACSRLILRPSAQAAPSVWASRRRFRASTPRSCASRSASRSARLRCSRNASAAPNRRATASDGPCSASTPARSLRQAGAQRMSASGPNSARLRAAG